MGPPERGWGGWRPPEPRRERPSSGNQRNQPAEEPHEQGDVLGTDVEPDRLRLPDVLAVHGFDLPPLDRRDPPRPPECGSVISLPPASPSDLTGTLRRVVDGVQL